MTETIGFIGAGNMARSLIGGLLANDWPANHILVADHDADQRRSAGERLGVHASADNHEIALASDILVLAVKPQALKSVARDLASTVKTRPSLLLVSIAAGVRSADLDRWLGGNLPLVRAMPNTPALVNSGATGLYANDRVSSKQRNAAESLLRACGVAVWVENEALLDVVTALSGSGPAYFFLMMEALEAAAVKAGLPRDAARLLTLETAFGAAKMALEGGEEPAQLRQRVTSPGGTTERAIQAFEDAGFREACTQAIQAAIIRAQELGDMLGAD